MTQDNVIKTIVNTQKTIIGLIADVDKMKKSLQVSQGENLLVLYEDNKDLPDYIKSDNYLSEMSNALNSAFFHLKNAGITRMNK